MMMELMEHNAKNVNIFMLICIHLKKRLKMNHQRRTDPRTGKPYITENFETDDTDLRETFKHEADAINTAPSYIFHGKTKRGARQK
jgi:hypothetical protein